MYFRRLGLHINGACPVFLLKQLNLCNHPSHIQDVASLCMTIKNHFPCKLGLFLSSSYIPEQSLTPCTFDSNPMRKFWRALHNDSTPCRRTWISWRRRKLVRSRKRSTSERPEIKESEMIMYVLLPETPKYVDKTNCAHRPPACRKAERSWKHLEGDNKRPVVLVTVKGYGIDFLLKPQQRVVPHTPEYHN